MLSFEGAQTLGADAIVEKLSVSLLCMVMITFSRSKSIYMGKTGKHGTFFGAAVVVFYLLSSCDETATPYSRKTAGPAFPLFTGVALYIPC
jgi:hypothetical protein